MSNLVLDEISRIQDNVKKLNPECKRKINQVIGICQRCGKKPKLKELLKKLVKALGSKAIKEVSRIGKAAGKLAKKVGKKILKHTLNVLKGVNNVFRGTGRAVRKAISGVRNAFRGVGRTVKRVFRHFRFRRFRPRIRVPRFRARFARFRRIVRIPRFRVRIPRIRVPRFRFGRRWGKKKKRSDLTTRQIEEITNSAMEQENPKIKKRSLAGITCSLCENDDALMDKICGGMRQLEKHLDSLEKMTMRLSNEGNSRSRMVRQVYFTEEYDENREVSTTVYVQASVDERKPPFSFKSSAVYNTNGCECDLQNIGVVIGKEAYQKYKEMSK